MLLLYLFFDCWCLLIGCFVIRVFWKIGVRENGSQQIRQGSRDQWIIFTDTKIKCYWWSMDYGLWNKRNLTQLSSWVEFFMFTWSQSSKARHRTIFWSNSWRTGQTQRPVSSIQGLHLLMIPSLFLLKLLSLSSCASSSPLMMIPSMKMIDFVKSRISLILNAGTRRSALVFACQDPNAPIPSKKINPKFWRQTIYWLQGPI